MPLGRLCVVQDGVGATLRKGDRPGAWTTLPAAWHVGMARDRRPWCQSDRAGVALVDSRRGRRGGALRGRPAHGPNCSGLPSCP